MNVEPDAKCRDSKTALESPTRGCRSLINGKRVTEKVLAHGDAVRFGEARDLDIVFHSDQEAPSIDEDREVCDHKPGILSGCR